MSGEGPFREALVDVGAIARNVARLRALAPTEHALVVVKANGYGHGALEAARAALAGGADWLGTADLAEALALRAGGVGAPILAWLHDPDADFGPALEADIDVGVSSAAQLDALAEAARGTGRAASAQIKIDTGLSRNGVAPSDWADVFARAARHERAGRVRIRGVFSHLSNASPEDDRAALAAFETGLGLAREAGLDPELTHIAATAAALSVPESRYDTVRLGIGAYGLSPFEPGDGRLDDGSAAGLGLVPAMTLRGRVAAVRRVPVGTGVSYGYDYRAPAATTLALVPLGYGDGVPRQASGRGRVLLSGAQHPVAGRIAMDQFVVDVGDARVAVGETAVLFGDPASGAPAADDWARAAGTINYDIVTRIGPRVPRRYVGR